MIQIGVFIAACLEYTLLFLDVLLFQEIVLGHSRNRIHSFDKL